MGNVHMMSGRLSSEWGGLEVWMKLAEERPSEAEWADRGSLSLN